MEYKIGQIYFWKDTDSLFGKLIDFYNIKTFGKSNTTHCGIIAEISADNVLIYEAGDKGFEKSEYPKSWLDNKITSGNVMIGEVNEKMFNVKNNCEIYIGVKYSWIDIVMITLKLIGLKIKLLTGKKEIICSEAVNYVVYDSTKKTNFAAEYGINPDAVTPQHIYQSKQITIVSK